MTETYTTTIPSPVGDLRLAGSDERLTAIRFLDGPKPGDPDTRWRESREPFREAIRQLEAYFGRELRDFDLPLEPAGTAFQLRVWQTLRAIPYGETISYRALAERIGRPTACRAVGAANGRNPIPIIVPCHRVIGASGDLTGFGGGLSAKRVLLALESPQEGMFSSAGARP